MCRRNKENSFDCKWDIRLIVQFILVRDLGISQMLVKHFIFIRCHFSLVSVPYGLHVVDEAAVEVDWELVEDRVLSDNLLNWSFTTELDCIFV